MSQMTWNPRKPAEADTPIAEPVVERVGDPGADPPVGRRIVLTCTAGLRWTAEFEGRITHRDLARLNRVIRTTLAKAQRKRSVERMKQRHAEEAARKEQNNGSD